MKKSLASKVAPWVFAGASLIGSGCFHEETLKVGSSKVSYKFSETWRSFCDVTEKKSDGTEIEYDISPGIGMKPCFFLLDRLKINGERYSSEDTATFNKAKERVKSLVDRYYFVRDSTRQANGLKALE